jgi:hypothetical protein
MAVYVPAGVPGVPFEPVTVVVVVGDEPPQPTTLIKAKTIVAAGKADRGLLPTQHARYP